MNTYSHYTTGMSKTVKTYDLNGKQNGYLKEIEKEGRLTKSYLTVAFPGCKKGPHLHRIRASNYTCVRGKIKVVLFTNVGRREIILDSNCEIGYDKLYIPTDIPTMIVNEWDEEGWLINTPYPYYDPDIKDEQLDMTESEANEYHNNLSE